MPNRKLMITKLFSWIGHKIGRPRGVDWRVYVRQGRTVDLTMLFFLVAVVGVGFYAPITKFFEDSFSAAADVVVERGEWKVLYEGGPECTHSGSGGCFSLPNSPLWKSELTLADKDHVARAREMQRKRFWAGVTLSGTSEKLFKARTMGTRHFIIGHVNAPFRAYVNGEKRYEGDGNDFLPVGISITESELSHGIQIAVEVNHVLGSAFPLAVGAPYPTGFFSDAKAKDFRNLWIITTIARPLAFGITGLMVFSVFFFLWLSVKDRSEYLAYSLFALCLFAIQMMHWGVVKWSLQPQDWYLVDLALRFSEGIFAGALGFTYARVRREIVFGTMLTGLIIFAVCDGTASTKSDLIFQSAFLARHYVPLMYLFGAIACFAASQTCDEESKIKGGDRRLDVRTRRLFTFGVLLLFLGVLYFNNANHILLNMSGIVANWYRPIQLLVVVLIGAFIFRDYREFDFIMETSAQSRFHDPHAKEQKIYQGVMLHIDLKGSSKLYNWSAEHGLATKLPTRWCEAATQILKTLGGEHLSSGGDSLFGFFPGDKLVSAERALSALIAIEKFSKQFSLEIGNEVSFRAVVLAGAIRPIYKNMSGKRFEDYEDAPGETVFKDANRLLEVEKKTGLSESVLVVEDEFRFLASKLFSSIKTEKASVRDVGTRDLFFFRIESLNSNSRVA